MKVWLCYWIVSPSGGGFQVLSLSKKELSEIRKHDGGVYLRREKVSFKVREKLALQIELGPNKRGEEKNKVKTSLQSLTGVAFSFWVISFFRQFKWNGLCSRKMNPTVYLSHFYCGDVVTERDPLHFSFKWFSLRVFMSTWSSGWTPGEPLGSGAGRTLPAH